MRLIPLRFEEDKPMSDYELIMPLITVITDYCFWGINSAYLALTKDK